MPVRPVGSLIVCGAALAGALAAAGTVASEIRETPIPVIEVVGKREGDVARQTGTVVILTREDIEILAPLSNQDVLRRVPGVNVVSEEETAIVSNIGIRGLSASETKSLILEDGVPVAPGLFIGNERYFNPRIQRVERVEILKGSASLRYGPSTIGGVVNYLTKTPDDGVLLSARVGSYNLLETSLEAGGRSASGDAFAGIVATYANSDGFMDKAYDMTDVFVKAGMAIGSNQQVGVKFSYHDNEADISYRGLLLGDFEAGATYNSAPDDRYLTDRRAFDITHRWTLSDNVQLSTLVYWSDITRDYWRYDVDTPASNAAGRWVFRDTLTGNNRSFERYGVETRLTVAHPLFGRDSETEVGLRAMHEESDDKRVRATRDQDRTGPIDRHLEDSADSVAAYVQNRLHVTERLAVTPGLRVESYTQERKVLTDNNASADTSNTEWLPGIGATYQLMPAAQLYGGVYRAFSPASNGVALDGLIDQELEGEQSDNFELGVRGTFGALNYEVALFRMDFSNQVVTGNSDPNLSRSNAGKTLHEGGELVLGYAFARGLSVDGNLTWIPTSEFRSGEHRGNRIPYAPEWLANLGLRWVSEAGLSIALLANYTGSQFGDGANTRDIPANAAPGLWGGKLDSYTLYDLTAQYTLNEQWTFFGAVKNLTDERYIPGLRQGIYVGPERSFEIGARVRL